MWVREDILGGVLKKVSRGSLDLERRGPGGGYGEHLSVLRRLTGCQKRSTVGMGSGLRVLSDRHEEGGVLEAAEGG